MRLHFVWLKVVKSLTGMVQCCDVGRIKLQKLKEEKKTSRNQSDLMELQRLACCYVGELGSGK